MIDTGKARIKFHYDQFGLLRSDAAIQSELEARAQAIATAAGGGDDFSVISSPGRDRARCVVVTSSERGREAEANDRALSNALEAGRG